MRHPFRDRKKKDWNAHMTLAHVGELVEAQHGVLATEDRVREIVHEEMQRAAREAARP